MASMTKPTAHDGARRRTRGAGGLRRLFTRALVAAVFLGGAASASAVTLAKDAPDTVLHGETSEVSVTVTGQAGDPELYNLTIRDVLPAGVSYVPGSSSPAPSQIIAVGDGTTVLVWSNLTDVTPASVYTLRYRVAHGTALDVGSTYTNSAQALLQTNARLVPQVNASTGAAVAGSYTHQASGGDSTRVTALEITYSEPSPEGEILRGLHDHSTPVLVTVRANSVNPVTGVVVDDYLPANFEFLGCGGIDNTTAGVVEYPGAPRLTSVPAAPSCTMPGLVETVVVDPDGPGPLPTALYTHVRWTSAQIPALATMNPGDTITFGYRAGVPLQQNTTTWSGGTAPATTGPQAANLDNNNGPVTADEDPIVSPATAAGTYHPTTGAPIAASDSTTLIRTAEDVRMRKSTSVASVQNGDIVRFSYTIDVTEYQDASGISVVDTIPDGLCPLGSVNHETTPPAANTECNPVGGQTPSRPYTSVTENVDGTFSVRWDIPALAHNGTLTVSYPVRVRRYYQQSFANVTSQPVLANDALANTIRLTGDATGTPTGSATTVPITDESSAEIVIQPPSIQKTVANQQSSMPSSCNGATYVDGTASGAFRPGDRVCFRLRATFPSQAFTGDVRISDFLPPGLVVENWTTRFDHNSGAWTADTTQPGVIIWTRSSTIPDGGQVFSVQLSAIVTDPIQIVPGQIAGNLMKLRSTNSDGQTFPLRDDANFVQTEPNVALAKSVVSINGVTGTTTAQGGDQVVYRLQPSNQSSVPVLNTEIWDNLPPGIACANVIALPTPSPGAVSCVTVAGQARIVWTGVSLPANTAPGGVNLTYTVRLPDTYAPNQTLTNTAGVRQFQATTNRGTNYTYIPQNNIDPTQPANPSDIPAADRINRGITGPARATATVTIRDVGITKERTGTSLTENGNSATEAVPGETISYRVTVTIPDGVTVTSGRITESLGPNQRIVPSSVVATVNGATIPTAGWTINTSTLQITAPTPLLVPDGAGPRIVVLNFDAVVLNTAGNTVTNQANVTWNVPGTGDRTVPSQTISTTIKRPALTVVKSTDLGSASPTPDGYVTYTLAVTNTAAANRSRAHDVVVNDVLPPGMIPVDTANTPIAATVGLTVPCPVTPNPTTSAPAPTCSPVTGANPATQTALSPRALRWTIPVIEPGATVLLHYRVKVPVDELAHQTLTNTVTGQGDSHPGNNPDQLVVDMGTSHTLTWSEPTVTKSVSRPTQVVGGTVQYTVDVVIPPGVRVYDSLVTDRLPDGMSLVSYDSATCVSGCTVGDPLTTITPITQSPQGDGSVLVGWWINDVPSSTVARTARLTYTTRIDTTYTGTGSPPAGTPVDGGAILTNAAQLQWSPTDQTNTPPTAPPAPQADGPTTSPVVNAPVTVIRPQVIMNKHVSCDGADPGPPGGDTDACSTAVTTTPFTYTITVRNTGTSPAHDVTVTDVIPATLTDVTIGALEPGVTTVAGTPPNLQWRIAEIPVNATVTITYTARWRDSTLLPTTATAVNTAAVPSYYGANQADRDAAPAGAFPTYTDGGSDIVTLTALFPNATVAKTTGAGTENGDAEVNQPFTWRITVRNDSSTTANDVRVFDELPANWEFVTGSTTITVDTTPVTGLSTTPTVTGRDIDWDTGHDLAPGRTMTVVFQARPLPAVLDDPPPLVYTNTATARVEDGMGNTGNLDGPYTSGPDTATATIVLPQPAISKVPDSGSVTAGQAGVPYSILASNFTGSVDLRNAAVTDVLPTGLTFNPASVQLESCTPGPVCTVVPGGVPATVTGQTVRFDLGTIPAGQAFRINYTVNVGSPMVNGTVLTNTARLTADEISPNTVITDTGSVTVGSTPVWFGPGDTTIKGSTPVTGSTVAPASQITYSITYFNSGNANATDVVLTDEIPANTTYVAGTTSTNDSATVTYRVGGVYQATEPGDPTQVEAVRWTVPTVNAGTGGTQTFRVRVHQPLPDGTVIENLASISSDQTPTPATFGPDPFDPSVPVLHNVRSAPILSLEKAVDKTTIQLTRGTNLVTYTLRLANTGDADATDVVVEDSVPAGVTLASIADGGAVVTCSTDPGTPGFTFGSCPADLGTVTRIRWTLPVVRTQDTVPVSTPRPPVVLGFAVTVPVPTVDGTVIPNRADLSSDQTGPDRSNEVSTVVRSSPDVAVVKGLTLTQASPGQEVSYLVTATNSGTTEATNAVLTDEIPAGTVYAAGSATGAAEFRVSGAWQAVEPANPVDVTALRWHLGTLGIDQSASRGFRVLIPSNAPRSLTAVTNSASFTSDQASTPSNVVRTTVMHPALPSLTIVKRGPARLRAGKDGTWRITVKNTGKATATKVVITDVFPSRLVVRSRSAGGRIVSGRIVWNVGSLRPGQSKTVWVRFRAPLTVRGRVVNRATVTATNVKGVKRAQRPLVILAAAGVSRVPVVG